MVSRGRNGVPLTVGLSSFWKLWSGESLSLPIPISTCLLYILAHTHPISEIIRHFAMTLALFPPWSSPLLLLSSDKDHCDYIGPTGVFSLKDPNLVTFEKFLLACVTVHLLIPHLNITDLFIKSMLFHS